MKVLFKNETEYSKENCRRFIKFHVDKFRKKEIIKSFTFMLCVIYMIIFNIVQSNWIILLYILGISVIVYVLFLIRYKKKSKKNEKMGKKVFTFYFYNRHIKVKYKRKFERIFYITIKKIYETDDNFFLYLNDSDSLIIDKKGFLVGNAKDFTKFIRKKCLFKYFNERKRHIKNRGTRDVRT